MAHFLNPILSTKAPHKDMSQVTCFFFYTLMIQKTASSLRSNCFLGIQVVNDPLLTAAELKNDLDLISKCAYQWKISFNAEISKEAVEMLFYQKKKKIDHRPLLFNGTVVSKMLKHKHLGLTFDKTLTTFEHINQKIDKIRTLVGVMKFFCTYFPITYIGTNLHFDYCDVIYHIPLSTNSFDLSLTIQLLMISIKIIQYQACLIIAVTWKGISRNK